MTAPTCHVTVWNPHLSARFLARSQRPCGEPADDSGLCADHRAERDRLATGRVLRKGAGDLLEALGLDGVIAK